MSAAGYDLLRPDAALWMRWVGVVNEPSGASTTLSGAGRRQLDDLLSELLARVGEAVDAQDRLRGLLEAVVGISADLDLDSVLQRLVRAACELAGARYGALGVLRPDGGGLQAFILHGISAEERARIGSLPQGRGLLGAIVDNPEPLRLDAIQDDPRSSGFPPNHPPMTSFLGVPVRTRDSVYGNLYLTEKHGGTAFTADDEEIVVALAAAAGVVIENARLYEETTRRQRWLEAAAQSTAALLSDMTRDEALSVVAARAREVVDADVCAVLLRHNGGELFVEAAAGAGAETVAGSKVDDKSAWSALLDAGEAVVVPAGENDRADLFGLSPKQGWPDLTPLLLVPLHGSGPVAGMLVLGWGPQRQYVLHESEERPALAFAERVTLALQLAQAQADRGRLAVLEDRDRIARDLHDLVIQRLFALGLGLEKLSRAAGEPDLTSRLSNAVDDLDATIKDIRRTIFELSVPPENADVRAALGEAVAVMAPALGFSPRLHTDGPVDSVVTEELRAHLVAVVRETLSNIARHAQATSADIDLAVGEDVVLMVSDNGIGMRATERRSGLRNMYERAESLGGKFEMHRRPSGDGTVAVWRVPVRRGAF